MCQISDRIFSEGEKNGIIKGKTESIVDLTEAMHISDEQAMDVFKIDKSERPLYASYVKAMRAARAVTNP